MKENPGPGSSHVSHLFRKKDLNQKLQLACDMPTMKISEDIHGEEVLGLYREALPTHFSFKIKSFSLLAKSSIEKCESNYFEAGGYKWKLSLYPNGNKKEDGEHYISIYLEMVDTSSLSVGLEVDASFRFFVFDQIRDKYLILGDLGGCTRRFHGMKTKWGFSKLLPITTLNDPSYGYLVDDTCIFGTEVFICKSTGNGDCLIMESDPTTFTHTWKIENFSQHKEDYLLSEVFMAGGQKWIIRVHPIGDAKAKNHSLTVCLFLADWKTLTSGMKVYADYKLRVRNQVHENHRELQGTGCFSTLSKGWSKLTGLSELKGPTNGFLVKDTCIIEAEITVLGIVMKNNNDKETCRFPSEVTHQIQPLNSHREVVCCLKPRD